MHNILVTAMSVSSVMHKMVETFCWLSYSSFAIHKFGQVCVFVSGSICETPRQVPRLKKSKNPEVTMPTKCCDNVSDSHAGIFFTSGSVGWR